MACANLLPECTYLCCSWKAPRVFSGWFASTTQSQGQIDEKRWRKSLSRSWSHASNCSDCTVQREWNRNKFEDCFTEDAHGFPVAKIYRRQKKGSRTLFRCGSGLESQNTSEKITPDTLWEDLRPTISYLSSMQLGMVWDALQLAFEAHEGQKRKSGEPYIIHPVEVARILGELELDWESIAAGLLHDTVEDTNVVTFERIEQQFGPAVRRIVEGETKVSKLGKLQCASTETVSRDVKADDLRQMFLAMTEEVRVIIVKLADRLHNMRTLMHMPPHKQRYIALETLQVFAPLARLLGMYKIKSELEDLSFMYAHPEDYASLKKRVNEVYQEHEEEALEAKRSLLQRIGDDQFLGFMSVDVRVHALCKELYSIYKKLLESKGSIYEVQDITQLRVILQEKPRATGSPLSSSLQICYHVLGLVHQMWTPVPQSMKDYIATPKPNGYQSLHTKVLPFLYGNTFRLEVQIRTEEMDILAKRGIAAHYSGKVSCQALLSETCASKGSTNFLSNADLARRVSWLNAIREWQEEFVGNMTAREFVDTVTGDLLGSRVFVFTPKGEIKNLPKGATVVDYAYQIHTELGNKMVAAKVNGNLVSPAHTLANAEVVEVITYNGLSTKSVFQKHRQWLQYARTRSARHKITKFLKEQAALSADDITADAIKEFISGLGEVCMETLDNLSTMEVPNNDSDPRPKHLPSSGSPSWSATLENVKSFLAGDIFPSKIPHVNGKHNKKAEEMAVKFTGTRNFLSSGTPRFIAKPAVLDLLSMDEAAMIGLESWQTLRVGLWHEKRKQSIQWFSVLCIDRSSMLAEVTAILGAAGIIICGCAAEADQIKGLGIMLFHVDGSTEDMMNACASIDSIEGVLSWSVGCSWPRTQTPSTLYL